MSEKEDRDTAARIIRAFGAGAEYIPVAGPLISMGLEAVAGLVETVGTAKAEEELRDIVANPARLITKADLDAQTAAIIDELTGDEHPDDDPDTDTE